MAIIGNEILSGRTRDANLEFIGAQLATAGIRLVEARIVRDDKAAIVAAVNQLREVYDYVMTTGGIGPTHDDITTRCIAAAFGVAVERNAAAERMLRDYYGDAELSEARLKMADIPAGARLIENPVSGAPGYQLENVFVLPGVPRILRAMFASIVGAMESGTAIATRAITAFLPESVIAPGLAKIQTDYAATEIGSYPFSLEGRHGTTLVVRGTDSQTLAAAVEAIVELCHGLGAEHVPGEIPRP